MRGRLKEAKGIGTPATRAEIIKGLKWQNLLAADGKLVVPTPAGLQLFQLLRDAAPALVDPGTTAQWEMQRLPGGDYGIAAEAETLIAALRQRPKGAVDLQAVLPAEAAGNKRPGRKSRGSAKATSEAKVAGKPASAKPKRARKRRAAAPVSPSAAPSASPRTPAPTARMVIYAEKLAKSKGAALPAGYATDFQTCRGFLDQHG